ncbi:type IV pilin protein [Ectobacillus ponti]|uniref:Prepilin-type N-terminal cleavage/methylation domain-containing protein n=1 Tax=Ectobacillus ponti TaxID=2961894 RepID=A0AA42BNY4_9BACI|nr:prepilin-type N-terminal cleavage/methylation domain-containing protein [Ectobacillus ponti]MCP8968500.1 prepilin-type N-terminal cleavage/methylation domain-containing protein [Ectobacillus ponti]
MRKLLRNEKGLTLIELLAVIVILGIVAAIAIPAIANVIQKSNVNAVKADAMQILNAAKTYVADNGVPASGTISNTDMGDYVSDSKISTYTVTVGADGKTFTISASNVTAGKIQLTFNNASIQNIRDDANYKTTHTISAAQ